MKEAIEITTFKLNGCTYEQFIAANADIDAWLLRQPGFRSRRMARRSDAVIVDMLIWDSAAEGTGAMHRLMDELRDSPVHAMIDQASASWTIAPVRHHIQSGTS